MSKRTVCIFNRTRESFLSLSVTKADTMSTRLKCLIGRARLKSDEGLWVVPSQGIHTVGTMFPIDVIYLDADNRVIHLIEHFRNFRMAPLFSSCASILQLPPRTIYSSDTQVGDQLVICLPEQMGSQYAMMQATA